MNNHSIHGQKNGLVDWPYKRPLTNYEPNATVEVSNAQVTFILLPSRRAGFSSACKSGEDATTPLVSSEVDEKRRKAGFTTAHA